MQAVVRVEWDVLSGDRQRIYVVTGEGGEFQVYVGDGVYHVTVDYEDEEGVWEGYRRVEVARGEDKDIGVVRLKRVRELRHRFVKEGIRGEDGVKKVKWEVAGEREGCAVSLLDVSNVGKPEFEKSVRPLYEELVNIVINGDSGQGKWSGNVYTAGDSILFLPPFDVVDFNYRPFAEGMTPGVASYVRSLVSMWDTQWEDEVFPFPDSIFPVWRDEEVREVSYGAKDGVCLAHDRVVEVRRKVRNRILGHGFQFIKGNTLPFIGPDMKSGYVDPEGAKWRFFLSIGEPLLLMILGRIRHTREIGKLIKWMMKFHNIMKKYKDWQEAKGRFLQAWSQLVNEVGFPSCFLDFGRRYLKAWSHAIEWMEEMGDKSIKYSVLRTRLDAPITYNWYFAFNYCTAGEDLVHTAYREFYRGVVRYHAICCVMSTVEVVLGDEEKGVAYCFSDRKSSNPEDDCRRPRTLEHDQKWELFKEDFFEIYEPYCLGKVVNGARSVLRHRSCFPYLEPTYISNVDGYSCGNEKKIPQECKELR